jgi:hypothetical protein
MPSRLKSRETKMAHQLRALLVGALAVSASHSRSGFSAAGWRLAHDHLRWSAVAFRFRAGEQIE